MRSEIVRVTLLKEYFPFITRTKSRAAANTNKQSNEKSEIVKYRKLHQTLLEIPNEKLSFVAI